MGAPETLGSGWRQPGTMFLGFQVLVKASASVLPNGATEICFLGPPSGWGLGEKLPFSALYFVAGAGAGGLRHTLPSPNPQHGETAHAALGTQFSLQALFQQRLRGSQCRHRLPCPCSLEDIPA